MQHHGAIRTPAACRDNEASFNPSGLGDPRARPTSEVCDLASGGSIIDISERGLGLVVLRHNGGEDERGRVEWRGTVNAM